MPCFSIKSKLLSEEIESRMEGAICQGWLTKSPPEKKMPGPRRIFPSKWRKRYFVLRMPPAASSLPGSCGLLEYYDSPRCTKRKGSIDLDQCEEVTISLDTYDYRNLFSLTSKHKGRNRTYYLAAENESTMNHWVECLCKVCGFKPEDDRPAGDDDWPTLTAPVPVQAPPRYTPDFDRPPHTDMPDIVPRPVHSPEPETLLTGSHSYNSRRMTGQSGTSVVLSSPGRGAGGGGSASGKLELDSVPPPPSRRELRASVDSTDSVPEELAPEPPGKSGQPRLEEGGGLHDPTTYDHPRKSYVNLPPHQNPENTYQVPPPPTPVGVGGRRQTKPNENMLVNVPPASHASRDTHASKRDSNSSSGSSRGSHKHAGDSANSSEDTYDPVPPPRRYSGDRHADHTSSSALYQRSNNGATKGGHGHHKAHSDNNMHNLNETVPPPSSLATQQPYINIPPNSPAHPSYENLEDCGPAHTSTGVVSAGGVIGVLDTTYDVPPPRKDDADILCTSPPPPPHQLPKLPHYVNTPPSFKPNIFVPPPSPASSGPATDDDVYLPMKPGSMGGQTGYLPMTVTSMQESYVPLPKGASDKSDRNYLNMDQCSSGGGSSSAVYRNRSGGSSVNDSVYLPMQRPDNDTYMPMVGGAENYMPMSGVMDRSNCNSVYTDMSSGPPAESQQPATHSIYEVPPSNKPVPVVPPRTAVEPPRLQPQSAHAPTNVTDGVLMFGSHRTRSFKREVPRQPPLPDVPLPRKKATVSTGDSSSSDDDDGSSSSLDRSSDTIPAHKPPKVDMLSKKSLNSTPPPPKRPGEVQYLDLALEKGSDSERSPVFPRSPPPPASRHGNSSPTEYKEIDFVKTKALTETKKDVESKRKSSEKSVDE